MRTPDEIFYEVEELIITQMVSIADHRRTRSSEADARALEARGGLLPLLQEAAELRSIGLLLRIERSFLRSELGYIAHARQNIAALRAGIWQIDAATAMLNYVRDPKAYQWAGIFYAFSNDFLRNLNVPRDGAHKFFASHRTRLSNMASGLTDNSQAALFDARISNIKRARQIYIELQRQALATPGTREQMPEPAPSEVREPAKPYRVERKLKLAA